MITPATMTGAFACTNSGDGLLGAPGDAVETAMGQDWVIMTAWFVIVVPLVILFFALFMERVEARLSRLSVREEEVEEFLDQARPDEVNELFDTGIGDALEKFRDRRVPGQDAAAREQRTETRRPVGSNAQPHV